MGTCKKATSMTIFKVCILAFVMWIGYEVYCDYSENDLDLIHAYASQNFGFDPGHRRKVIIHKLIKNKASSLPTVFAVIRSGRYDINKASMPELLRKYPYQECFDVYMSDSKYINNEDCALTMLIMLDMYKVLEIEFKQYGQLPIRVLNRFGNAAINGNDASEYATSVLCKMRYDSIREKEEVLRSVWDLCNEWGKASIVYELRIENCDITMYYGDILRLLESKDPRMKFFFGVGRE